MNGLPTVLEGSKSEESLGVVRAGFEGVVVAGFVLDDDEWDEYGDEDEMEVDGEEEQEGEEEADK